MPVRQRGTAGEPPAGVPAPPESAPPGESSRIEARRRRVNAGARGYPQFMKSFYTAVMQRITGERPSAMRAFAGATAAGTATGVLVYRLLRQQTD